MRLWTDAMRGLLAFALAACCAACGRPGGDADAEDDGSAAGAAGTSTVAVAASTNAPIENLRIPLAVWPNGKVRTQVNAASAQIPEADGDVVASRIRIEMFRENGELENLVMAQDCRYNREKGVATSDSNVHVEREGALMTGRGFEWNGSNEVVKVRNNVKVTLQRNIRWDAAVPSGKEGKVAE